MKISINTNKKKKYQKEINCKKLTLNDETITQR